MAWSATRNIKLVVAGGLPSPAKEGERPPSFRRTAPTGALLRARVISLVPAASTEVPPNLRHRLTDWVAPNAGSGWQGARRRPPAR